MGLAYSNLEGVKKWEDDLVKVLSTKDGMQEGVHFGRMAHDRDLVGSLDILWVTWQKLAAEELRQHFARSSEYFAARI